MRTIYSQFITSKVMEENELLKGGVIKERKRWVDAVGKETPEEARALLEEYKQELSEKRKNLYFMNEENARLTTELNRRIKNERELEERLKRKSCKRAK
jgi:hypothetical protein